jgi:hypothetical protein
MTLGWQLPDIQRRFDSWQGNKRNAAFIKTVKLQMVVVEIQALTI